jgi:hypothetical protein
MEDSEVNALGALFGAVNLDSSPSTPVRASLHEEAPTIQKPKFRIRLKKPSKSTDTDASFAVPVPDLSSVEADEASKQSQPSESPSVASTADFGSSIEPSSVVSEPEALTVEETIICKFLEGIFADSEISSKLSDAASSALPPQNKWVKEINFAELVRWEHYKKKKKFKRVACICPDVELVEEQTTKGKKSGKQPKKQPGEKKRQTLIQFDSTIPADLWKEPVEWLYILVIAGYIVKIGGTRVGLDERCKSYLSGHCVPEKGGKSVSTNAFIYHTFHWYLEQGMPIEMYGYRIPPKYDTDTLLGFKVTYPIQRYHVFEARILGEFEKLYGKKPPLSSNSDPKYRQ